nr:unnamed protein product [Spirometra erinaceieuropaei]
MVTCIAEGIMYEQIKGIPMGSPISGLIVEGVLQKLEKRLFEKYKPQFWTRYLDDTFVVIDRNRGNYYAKLLNSIIPDLQFTMKDEVEDQLLSLDVLVCRQPNGNLQKTGGHVEKAPLQQQPPATAQTSRVRALY